MLSLALLVSGIQLYRYCKYEGNVLIYICNDSNLESIDLEVYLDGIKQVSDSFSNKIFHGYHLFPVSTSLGLHTLEVKAENLGPVKKVDFRVFAIRSVIIEVGKELISSNNPSEYEVVISLRHKPLTWID